MKDIFIFLSEKLNNNYDMKKSTLNYFQYKTIYQGVINYFRITITPKYIILI